MTGYKDIPCPVCKSKEFKVRYPDTLKGEFPRFNYAFSSDHCKTYRIVECLNCRHVYCSPLPLDLWEHYVDVKDVVYLRNQNCRYATAKKVISKLRRFCPQGRLLDIGCATGDFLTVAREYYDVEGLELSQWSSELARDRGLKIFSGRLSNMEGENLFDVITLWGVIEHFEDPLMELSQIYRLLKPNGIVALWTGDVDCVLSRLLGRKWWYIQGQHIQVFSLSSLSRLFLSARFQKEWMGWYPYVLSYEAIGLSLGRYPVLGRILHGLMRMFMCRDAMITIALPGEMFAIFKKKQY